MLRLGSAKNDQDYPMARVAKNPEDRRKTLLEAAKRIVENSGADSLSMRTLAAATGTSPMSAYELFGSKDGLLIELLQARRGDYVRRLAKTAKGSELERFFYAVELSASEISENFNFFQAAAFRYFSPAGAEMRKTFSSQRRALVGSLLSKVEAECDGFKPNLSVKCLAKHVDSLYIGALFHWMVCDGNERQFVRQFGLGCALALKGVVHQRFHRYLDERIEKYST